MSRALYLIFFLSGVSALMFETLWFRLAGLTLGNSIWASSLVLASFMAGLALGNLLAARHGPRLRRPLETYAALEVAIGLTGFGLVLLFPILTPLMSPYLLPFLDAPWILNPFRLGLSFLLLLVPSTAMGATLPLLVKTVSARDENFGRVLGRLYGWNTLGAVVGALVGEMLLIEALGIRGTGAVAGLANLTSASGAFLVSRRMKPPEAAPEETPALALRRLGPVTRRYLAAGFLSGALVLALEVVWFRFLLLFVEGTSLTFALMLSVVLLGIASGGWFASWWLGARPDASRFLPILTLVAGVSVAVTYMIFEDGSGLYARAASFPISDPGTVLLLAIKLVFPLTFVSGIVFTFVGKCVEREVGDKTRAAGLATLANTLGAMSGPLLAGFVLIPYLGMEPSFFCLAVGYGGMTLLVLQAPRELELQPGWERRTVWATGALFVTLMALFPFGLMNNHYVPLVLRPFTSRGAKLVATRQSVTETAFYLRADLFGTPLRYRLATNGFSMSTSDFISRRYMSLFAHLPLALNPEIDRALLISYGLGVTAKTLTDARHIESIDVVDISEGILDLSRDVDIFRGTHPLTDPRVSIHIEDGRFFLQTTDERYDLITGEPPPPKYSGVVNLYSAEYFHLLHDRLAEGGLATYWLPVYQLEVRETKAVVKAFCEAFEDCSLWTAAGEEWMLMGTRGLEKRLTVEEFSRRWRDPVSGPSLRAIGIEEPELLSTTFLADAVFLREWTAGVPPVEDNYPYRLSPRHRGRVRTFDYSLLMATAATKERFRDSPLIQRLWPRELQTSSLQAFDVQESLNGYFADGSPDYVGVYQLLADSSLRTIPLILMGSSTQMDRVIERAEEKGIVHPMLDYLRSARAMSRRDYERALRHLDAAVQQAPENKSLAGYRVLAYALAGRTEEALRGARSLRAADPAFVTLLGEVADETSQQ